MPTTTRRQAGGKQGQKGQQGQQGQQAAKRVHEPVDGVEYATSAQLRERAAEVRASHSYEGRLTPAMLLDLEPLLNEALNPRYIVTTPPTQGKPYESTGIRSVQVQTDRLNAVLGAAHWRKLLHYTDGGAVCHAHLIVGNDLAAARLDDRGDLVTFTTYPTDHAGPPPAEADVIAHRSGWGGHSRGSNRGDLYKGAETNALKRAIAQLGPGSEVYRLDFDEDHNTTGRQFTEPEAGREPTPPAEDPVHALTELLKGDDDDADAVALRALDRTMQVWGFDVANRVQRLRACRAADDTPAAAGELNDRITLAIEERDGERQPSLPVD